MCSTVCPVLARPIQLQRILGRCRGQGGQRASALVSNCLAGLGVHVCTRAFATSKADSKMRCARKLGAMWITAGLVGNPARCQALPLQVRMASDSSEHKRQRAAMTTCRTMPPWLPFILENFWLKGTALKGFCLEVFDHRRVDLLRCLCKSEVCTVWRGHQIAYPAIVLNQLLSLAREVSIK